MYACILNLPMTLIGNFNSEIASKAPTTLVAPMQSARMSPMPFEGLMDIPPESNVTPFPIKKKKKIQVFM